MSPSHRVRLLSLRRQGRTLVLTLGVAVGCGGQAATLRNVGDAAIGLSGSPGRAASGQCGQVQQRWHLATLGGWRSRTKIPGLRSGRLLPVADPQLARRHQLSHDFGGFLRRYRR